MNLLLKEMYVYVLLFQYRSSPMRWHPKATILTNLIFEKLSFQYPPFCSAIVVYLSTLTTKASDLLRNDQSIILTLLISN